MASLFSFETPEESRASLGDIFVEQPVDLKTFVEDKKFLGNPSLSPIQYDAVRHIEQIYHPETYDLMKVGFGKYWEPVRYINYATLVFGKGCILPYEKVYDPSTGRWNTVESLSSEEGQVLSMTKDHSFSTEARTTSFPHGYGECVRVTLDNGMTCDVYEGHRFFYRSDKKRAGTYGYLEARYLSSNHALAMPSKIYCENPVPASIDEITLAAVITAAGFFDYRQGNPSTKLFKLFANTLQNISGEDLSSLPLFWDLADLKLYYPNSYQALEDYRKKFNCSNSLDSPVFNIPDFIFSLPDEQLIHFIKVIFSFCAVDPRKENENFQAKFIWKAQAVDFSRLLLRFGVRPHLKDKIFKTTGTQRRDFFTTSFRGVTGRALVAMIQNDTPVSEYLDLCHAQPLGLYFSKVCDVTSIGQQEFWNLTVESTGNYMASGLVHANSGKDHIARIAALRIVYLLLCLENPQSYFGMPDQDTIHLLNVATARSQATRAYFTPLVKAVRNSPWFKDRGEPKQDTVIWDKNIETVSGHSEAESQEGLNLILGIADELDGFKSREAPGARKAEFVNSAENIVDMLHSSAKTRFPKNFKVVHISYPRYVGSPILNLLAHGKKEEEEYGAESRYYTSGPYATWDVHPNRTKADFAEDYRKDPIMARTKYECKPERAINPYFRNKEAIKYCMTGPKDAVLLDYQLQYSNSAPVWHATYGFNIKPIPGATYVIHADLALRNDRAGVAMSHVVNYQEHKSIGVDEEDGSNVERWETRPNLKVDFCFGYEADLSSDPAREIQIRWVRQLVSELRRLGFNIAKVSYDQFQCLSGDTSISLLDGREVLIKELAETSPEGGFWVYSVNKDGRVVPGKVTKAWKTGTRSDMVTVTLDNDEAVTCTSDHLFMLRDGSYKEAGLLVEGDSLMPLYRRTRKISPTTREYEQVHHPEAAVGQHRWQYTHSMSAGTVHRPAEKGEVVHHVDFSSTNNSPDNLQVMSSSDHSALHACLAGGRFEELWSDPEWAEAHKRRISASLSARQLGLRGKSTNRYKQDLTWEVVEEVVTDLLERGLPIGLREVSAELGCSRNTVIARAREHGYGQWREYKDYRNPPSYSAMKSRRWKSKQAVYNHKVMSVVPAPTQDVYDISVDEYHNFAVSSGVFVHNSADSMQILEAQGIETERISADINDNVWKNLRDLMYEGRVVLPNEELLYDELTSLMKMPGGKVDHPAGTGKDIADAVACSLYSALSVGGSESSEEDMGAFFDTASVYSPLPIGFPGVENLGLLGVPQIGRYNY